MQSLHESAPVLAEASTLPVDRVLPQERGDIAECGYGFAEVLVIASVSFLTRLFWRFLAFSWEAGLAWAHYF